MTSRLPRARSAHHAGLHPISPAEPGQRPRATQLAVVQGTVLVLEPARLPHISELGRPALAAEHGMEQAHGERVLIRHANVLEASKSFDGLVDVSRLLTRSAIARKFGPVAVQAVPLASHHANGCAPYLVCVTLQVLANGLAKPLVR